MVKDAYQIIKEEINQKFPLCNIYLFGSRARQNNTEISDYDILVVISENLSLKEKVNISEKIKANLAKYLFDVDLVIKSKEELNLQKNIKGHLIRTIFPEMVSL